ncbi:hypothetical protein PV10_00857 [Exophiala mesophila]|uniref:Translation initiation factor eIF2B subunit gamma n=1 Tax=Exophiala mesophila TaxID=212818 RepID=A0A0D2ADW5_EXOME|nr:uncharacterized protein PV10_00857 [Exophiala mesophila]KIV97058.1 hypothetical protein PV10_00857 [Exophiala mesophila]
MQQRFTNQAQSSISLLGDVDGIDSLANDLQQIQETGRVASVGLRSSLNPRIQFLRLSSIVRGRVGVLGATPPYQPAAPSLYRPLSLDQDFEDPVPTGPRTASPLRNIACSVLPIPRSYDSSPHFAIKYSTNSDSVPKPATAKMPQTGFQALILCGPGIGLSSFTSVPAEFPKALVEVANRPIIWYVLDWCYRMGVTDITLITPPTAKDPIAAALAQNPYLTSLPSPSPDLLAPKELEFETATAQLLRLPEVQAAIKSDFLLLPCDLVCDIPGESFLETYLTRLDALGGLGRSSNSTLDAPRGELSSQGADPRGRRGGLSIWYNTVDREESVKGEECDFMCTAKLDPTHDLPLSKSQAVPRQGALRKLVWTMPMSELWEQTERDKSWKIRHSLLRRHGAIKCLTKYRDSHIYFFPFWVKEFAKLNEDFESVSEDLVGTWAKAEWRKPAYRARVGARKLFDNGTTQETLNLHAHDRPVEEDIDLLSLSSTQISDYKQNAEPIQQRTAHLASRVHADPEDSILSPDQDDQLENGPIPGVPPILSYILPSAPDAPLVRRVDNTPLILSVSMSLAKIPSIEESTAARLPVSPFAHQAKVHPTVTVAPRVTISRADTLIDSNSTIATQCVIKSSVIGASVAIGTGTRITGCVIMSGATIGDKCVLTNMVVGKKAKIGSKSTLQNCEVQDGNAVADGSEGKGEKYLIGGLEDEVHEGEGFGYDDEGSDDGNDASSVD